MNVTFRVLMVEDSARDAELIIATLAADGIVCDELRVETKEDFVRALSTPEFDLILSDFSLPSFDGLTALQIARSSAPEIPFIFVSGTIGEEVAIEGVKNGATDYVLKQRLSRLGSAVRRAMAENEAGRAREQAERDRARAESLFRALFDQMGVGVLITELDGRIVRANRAMAGILGYSDPELEKYPIGRVVHAEGAKTLEERYRKLVSGDSGRHEFEERYLRQDGTTICGRTVLSLIREDSAPAFFVHLIEDITERKELERRYIEAQKMEVVGRMAAGIAHDFNNLLTVINGYSGLLLAKTDSDSETGRNLYAIQCAGEQATKLTQRLLSFGQQKAEDRSVVDLNEVITNLDAMIGKLAGEQVSVATSLDAEMGPIHADRSHLEQVMLNLVINSRDAMAGCGHLTISTRSLEGDGDLGKTLHLSPGRYAVLTVTDTGHGMDEATQARIFEPFFTTKEIGKGTGLGLWMVREITRQNGGAISVDSRVGVGTSFHICLPQIGGTASGYRTEGRDREDARGVNTKSSLRAPAILVADDDSAVRSLVCAILRSAGYDVSEAVHGRDALQILRKTSIDLFITDLIMPEREGLETIRKVRDEFRAVPVLAMSGGFGEQFLPTAKLLGAHETLTKPFDATLLLKAVERLLAAVPR